MNAYLYFYLCLDEVVALCPDVFQETQNINCAFVFYLLQHTVYNNVGSCPANTSTDKKTTEENLVKY